MAVIPKFVGERIKRREDPRLITGTGVYVDDVRLPGMLTAAVLRSPHAHAKISSIDLSKARALKGVTCVLSDDDVQNKIGPVPCVAPADHVIASYVEICGLGPSALLPPKLKGGGWESSTTPVSGSTSTTAIWVPKGKVQ